MAGVAKWQASARVALYLFVKSSRRCWPANFPAPAGVVTISNLIMDWLSHGSAPGASGNGNVKLHCKAKAERMVMLPHNGDPLTI